MVEVRKRLPPDVVAAIFWLKSRQPQIWRDERKTPVAEDTLSSNEARQHYAKPAEGERVHLILERCRVAAQLTPTPL